MKYYNIFLYKTRRKQLPDVKKKMKLLYNINTNLAL